MQRGHWCACRRFQKGGKVERGGSICLQRAQGLKYGSRVPYALAASLPLKRWSEKEVFLVGLYSSPTCGRTREEPRRGSWNPPPEKPPLEYKGVWNPTSAEIVRGSASL